MINWLPGLRVIRTTSSLRQPAGIDFIYQDDWLVILNKPAGIVVHPTYRHETGTLTDLLSEQPLHPVSRLDRDTSGLVMIARNGHAHYVVMQQPMKKTYLALVHGRMPERQGLIDAPISRDPDRIIKRRVDPSGAVARTLYREVHYFPAAAVSTVEFELLTDGRTRSGFTASSQAILWSVRRCTAIQEKIRLTSIVSLVARPACQKPWFHPSSDERAGPGPCTLAI